MTNDFMSLPSPPPGKRWIDGRTYSALKAFWQLQDVSPGEVVHDNSESSYLFRSDGWRMTQQEFANLGAEDQQAAIDRTPGWVPPPPAPSPAEEAAARETARQESYRVSERERAYERQRQMWGRLGAVFFGYLFVIGPISFLLTFMSGSLVWVLVGLLLALVLAFPALLLVGWVVVVLGVWFGVMAFIWLVVFR